MEVSEKYDVRPVKSEWLRPELRRLEAGAAESNFQGVPDNSNPQAS